MSDDRIYYWVYSSEQMSRIQNAVKHTGISPKFGKVIVKGTPKIYTDIITDMSKSPFGDVRLLVKGTKKEISYTEPNF